MWMSRRAAARQLYSNGTANAGDITLFVNTADFTVDFTAGTADVFYPNGQKLVSVSVFTTASGVTRSKPEPPSEIFTFGPMVTVFAASS